MRETTISIMDYINTDMNHKFLKKIILKPLGEKFKYDSFKVRSREFRFESFAIYQFPADYASSPECSCLG